MALADSHTHQHTSAAPTHVTPFIEAAETGARLCAEKGQSSHLCAEKKSVQLWRNSSPLTLC